MNTFKFDPTDPPEQNVEKFFEHLKTYDPDMANILLKNFSRINPLPDAPAQRSVARKSFSINVLIGLQQLQATKEEKSA